MTFFDKQKDVERVYRIWEHMRARCRNKNHKYFHRYGGRGIIVCSEWNAFESFLKDMGVPPSEKHSIDRINNNGNYEPNNCRWATSKEQNNNRADNRILKIKGETKTVSQWADYAGISQSTLHTRIRSKMPKSEWLRPVGKTHCKNGHSFKDNKYKSGGCKICVRAKATARYERLK